MKNNIYTIGANLILLIFFLAVAKIIAATPELKGIFFLVLISILLIGVEFYIRIKRYLDKF